MMAQISAHASFTSSHTDPVVRKIGVGNLWYALSKGGEDFSAASPQLVFLGLFYSVVGLLAARAAASGDLLP
jgi:uncharacterized membrane protein